ncbi:MAG: DUF1801 domain-containing protein [Anaerolineae bacterium]|nr:DUF1801 domain-containing protein [Anaerolineae bacterium]MCC7190860.1 DUF1801 domain-containing protein [Anaerolineales bacterium]
MAKNADIKTKVNKASVTAFLNKVESEQKRNDSFELVKIMQQVSKEKPKMWGPSIIGFGSLHYKYESGREGDMPLIAFSPRKQYITLYLLMGNDYEKPLLEKLGKHTTSKVCLYIKKLSDVDMKTLKELITKTYQASKALK